MRINFICFFYENEFLTTGILKVTLKVSCDWHFLRDEIFQCGASMNIRFNEHSMVHATPK